MKLSVAVRLKDEAMSTTAPSSPLSHANDDEDDEDIEELTVLVDLGQNITEKPSFLLDPYVDVEILGLDTESPVFRVGQYAFEGKYEDCIGTCVVFEHDSDQEVGEGEEPQWRLKEKTQKKLSLSRVFLKDKTKLPPAPPEKDAKPEEKSEEGSESTTSNN